jgi:hypothetical protein
MTVNAVRTGSANFINTPLVRAWALGPEAYAVDDLAARPAFTRSGVNGT